MDKKKPGYDGWQWLAMEADEQALVNSLTAAFNSAVNRDGTEGFEMTIDKASLRISKEEGRSGACHQLADGEAFFRVTVRAPDQQQGMALFVLGQHFATAGGAQVTFGARPELTLDRRDFLLPALQLKQLVPQALAAVRR